MKKITVEVYSDFVCPWCWIAKKRLEQAIGALPSDVEVEVVPRAFRLAKGMQPIAFEKALVLKTGSQARAQVFMEAIQEVASLEGLDYRFDVMRFGDTSAAHQYVKAISSPTLQAKYVERLYAAGTTEGRDIFDERTLKDLATEVGAADLFGFDSSEAAILSDEATVKGLGTGIPLFVVNGNRYLSGAQEVEVFFKVLKSAVEDLSNDGESVSGASCSISGCES
ncbi:DsbA family oxidoreductase [Pseudomonas plecoglossicida]|uniref:DsbA family oxidoreductase n=1 Tax=Pseudomonas putida group TaxID=136845 RepID=UPI00051D68AE|nr:MULTISPECIES: DsbA family oxidoreductase [Pseudomonas putida group]KGK23281.1 DSBA oxidoreductase [Pseudomonas plecoglossicida]MDQ7966685.1 DsbA family oxidoreductase [Pseudomonas plecoglossicida]WFG02795.1 DsbA family oxidoreductase [Pseudomonas putida]